MNTDTTNNDSSVHGTSRPSPPQRSPYARGQLAAERKYGLWRQLWDGGATVPQIAAKVGHTLTSVRRAIEYLRSKYGWFPRRPSSAQTLNTARWRELWDQGLSIAEIAMSQGLQTDYVRRKISALRRQHGWFPVRDFQAQGRAAAEAKYAPWMKLWDEGLSLAEMGARLGKSHTAIQSTMSTLRNLYGWFPHRVVPLEFRQAEPTTPAPRKVLKKYAEWLRLWKTGISTKKLAETLGANHWTVRAEITRMRRLHGLFGDRRRPVTREEKEAKFAPWRKLYDEGLSYSEMAAILNKTPHNVSNTVLRLRKRYGWFPPRPQPARPPA